MAEIFALEVFGRDLPSPGLAVAVILLVAAAFLVNRSDKSGNAGETGTGMQFECRRCGVEFQPEKVELLDSGDVRKYRDERCPHCGWELDWGDPDDKR